MPNIQKAARLVLALFAIQFGAARVSAAEVAIAAPVDCTAPLSSIDSKVLFSGHANIPPSCGSDTSLAEARQSRAELKEPKQRLTTTPQGLNRLCGKEPKYIWARPEEFNDGSKRLRALLDLAKSGRLDKGTQVVEATPSISGEQHLALCRVSAQGGPPRECDTVAILGGGESWLRGELDRTGERIPKSVACQVGGYSRVSGSIGIHWIVETGRDIQLFSKSLISLLSSEQNLVAKIKLTTDTDGKVYAVSIQTSAPLRNSKTLPDGWREAFDFYMDIRNISDLKKQGFEFDGSLMALVSRQAVGSQTQYQGLSDGQRDRYLAAFDDLVAKSITSACPKSTKVDAESFTCN
ncbi:MAG: hypothetical protein JO001_03585 [Alphaproteobacteria bacterium]|nr:hypothetical protein [Alphaproteobacteria bacterium]